MIEPKSSKGGLPRNPPLQTLLGRERLYVYDHRVTFIGSLVRARRRATCTPAAGFNLPPTAPHIQTRSVRQLFLAKHLFPLRLDKRLHLRHVDDSPHEPHGDPRGRHQRVVQPAREEERTRQGRQGAGIASSSVWRATASRAAAPARAPRAIARAMRQRTPPLSPAWHARAWR